MKIWKQHKRFSPEYLAKHHELVIYDIYHHIKAFLLFPPNCSCEDSCQCSAWRKKAILALNTNLYNKACEIHDGSNRLSAMKALWRLPDDHLYRELHPEAYPIKVIEKELQDREENGHFKIIDQLVWAFLCLGRTNELSSGVPIVSFNQATKIILGEAPINTKVTKLKKVHHPGGEKEYEKQFKQYKSVCHFIAALNMWKQEVPDWNRMFSCLYPPLEEIERFLGLAHWFRKNLLILERRNVKRNIFLLEEDLCPLPAWVQSYEVDFSIEPFEEKIQNVIF